MCSRSRYPWISHILGALLPDPGLLPGGAAEATDFPNPGFSFGSSLSPSPLDGLTTLQLPRKFAQPFPSPTRFSWLHPSVRMSWNIGHEQQDQRWHHHVPHHTLRVNPGALLPDLSISKNSRSSRGSLGSSSQILLKSTSSLLFTTSHPDFLLSL